MKRYILLLFVWHCITNINFINAKQIQDSCDNIHHKHNAFIELDDDIIKVIINLEHLLPNYSWSREFKSIFHDIHDEAIVASYSIVKSIIEECLVACTHLPDAQLAPIQIILKNYQQLLGTEKIELNINSLEDLNENKSLRKIKKICRLCVSCLNVTKHLYVNGYKITANSNSASAGTLSASYGQLSISSDDTTTFETADTWVPILFNLTGPSSNMGVSTTSPATITIQRNGVYQINFSLNLLAENSDEGIFTSTTYTIGLNVNGITTPITAFYVSEPGSYPFNYNGLMALSTNDTVQFYIKASNVEDDIFANNITLETGNAHLVQISN